MVYMIPAMLVEERVISKLFVTTTFVSGLAVTFFFVIKGVQTTAEVWARGGLVWAVEWITAAIVPIYVSKLALMESGVLTWGDLQAQAKAQSEATIAAFTGVGVCLVMAFVSYSLYVIARRRQKSA